MSEELALMPVTGEVVNLDDPNECARTLATLREIKQDVDTATRIVAAALIDYRERTGQAATFRVEAAEVKISEPTEIQWDMAVLRELLAAGLPAERWDALVETTVSTKVKATVAKQIAKANPAFAEIIGRAETRTRRPPTVSVAMRAPGDVTGAG